MTHRLAPLEMATLVRLSYRQAVPPLNVNRFLQVGLFHQQIIRVEGRDGEDADAGLGQRSR